MATAKPVQRRASIDATNVPAETYSPVAPMGSDEGKNNVDQILADFARFEWPVVSDSEESGGDGEDCPGLEGGDASSPEDSEEDESQKMLAKARALKLTDGMDTLDEELLQHLREIHDAWRRSFDEYAFHGHRGKSTYRPGMFPLHCLRRYRTLRAPDPDADDLIDALDGSFGPTLVSRLGSEDTDISELDLNDSDSKDVIEKQGQAFASRRASAPAKDGRRMSVVRMQYAEVMTASI